MSSCGRCGACSACIGSGGGLLQRQAPLVMRLRQRAQNFTGISPYDVHLVWTKWTGDERGEGEEVALFEVPIIPAPDVTDLSAVSLGLMGGGVLPMGSVRLQRINPQLTAEALAGRVIPPQAYFDGCRLNYTGVPRTLSAAGATLRERLLANGKLNPGTHIDQPYSFFYEIVETDVARAMRHKFRLASLPFKKPKSFEWTLMLEKISEDRTATPLSRAGIDPDR